MDVRAQPQVVTIDEIDGKRYKLLYFYEADECGELFNLTDDIGEKTNLAEDMPEVSASYQRKFRSGFQNIRLGSQNTLSVKKAALQSSHASSDLLQITR